MKNVLVFGTGKLFLAKKKYVQDNYNMVGFLDNKAKGKDGRYEDTEIPIYHPESVDRYWRSDVWIVLMSYDYVSMWKQLSELGISGEKIIFGIMLPPWTEEQEILFGQGGHLAVKGRDVAYYSSQNEEMLVGSHQQMREIAMRLLREKFRKEYPLIHAIAGMDTEPVSREFGVERGSAIDRYYIENFLEKNKEMICGDCLEIAENTYTLRYGGDRVRNSHILHLRGWGANAIKGNLETGEGIEADRYDCAIITQTLMFIFDIQKTAENIYKLLKKGGNALVTVSGISQISRYDADLWGSCYNFHPDAMRKLFEPLFGAGNVEIHSYGNVKTAVAMLCGLCREDLCDSDFVKEDPDYPVILSVVLKKK